MKYKKFLGAASTALMIVIIVILVLAPGAWAASKYKTLYKFTGGADGRYVQSGVIFDANGNLYGTATGGGTDSGNCNNWAGGCGVVYKLTANQDGTWTDSVLYTFTGGADGASPALGNLIFDGDGNLYGTTSGGGLGYGVVFKLTPNSSGGWTESVLYSFTGGADGAYPWAGVTFDTVGNLYGTVSGARFPTLNGSVFKLTPNLQGSWTESVLYSFQGGSDGAFPQSDLIFDAAGNLYGTTAGCVSCNNATAATVFKLTPNSNGSWTESVIYTLDSDPNGLPANDRLIFDAAGNLYGATCVPECYGGGPGWVFKLTPNSNGTWKEHTLHRFIGGKGGAAPWAGLTFDQAGNLFGTTGEGGAYGLGVVFELTPTSTGGWRGTLLHAFMGHPGEEPYNLTPDAAGNLYGTTLGGGGMSSVFEITP